MPITEELNNIKTLESVGFDHKQAEALTSIIEKTQVSGNESLKEFIRNELEKQTKDFDIKLNGFDIKLNSLESRLIASQKDLLIKIFGIIVGTVGVAVTILKLFP